MLNASEKAYCEALQALKRKDYQAATSHFDAAADYFKNNREFTLLRETTRLLLAVRRERQRWESADRIEIEEVFSHG
jgi:hypothetical protein